MIKHKKNSFDFDNDKFVFVHIPKCGGTSLHIYFQEVFGSSYIHIVPNVDWQSVISNIIGAGGHQYNGANPICKINTKKKLIKFTTLREPLSRFISYYKHIQSRPEHHVCKLEGYQKDFTLSQFAKFCIESKNKEFDNLMSRFVAGKNFENLKLSEIIEIFDNDFELFCPTEYIDFYYQKLSKFFQKDLLRIPKMRNVDRSNKYISEKEIEKAASIVYDHNFKDLRLYQHCTKRFINENFLN